MPRPAAGVAPAEAGPRGEEELQALWARFLDAADVVHHHSPGEGRRGWKAQRALKASGFRAGWPDSEVVWGGRTWFLELKTARGRLSPAQVACHADLRAQGAEVAVGRSLDELYGHLVRWGIPLRITPEEFRRGLAAPRAPVRMTAAQFAASGLAVASGKLGRAGGRGARRR